MTYCVGFAHSRTLILLSVPHVTAKQARGTTAALLQLVRHDIPTTGHVTYSTDDFFTVQRLTDTMQAPHFPTCTTFRRLRTSSASLPGAGSPRRQSGSCLSDCR